MGCPISCNAAAEAVYSEEGQAQIKALVSFYMENAKIIREQLTAAGLAVYGGVNAPYVWVQTPNNLSSWDFFDKLLQTVMSWERPVLVLVRQAKATSVFRRLTVGKMWRRR
jgi:aspartate/methionine/tyrosine aminotransferase